MSKTGWKTCKLCSARLPDSISGSVSVQGTFVQHSMVFIWLSDQFTVSLSGQALVIEQYAMCSQGPHLAKGIDVIFFKCSFWCKTFKYQDWKQLFAICQCQHLDKIKILANIYWIWRRRIFVELRRLKHYSQRSWKQENFCHKFSPSAGPVC